MGKTKNNKCLGGGKIKMDIRNRIKERKMWQAKELNKYTMEIWDKAWEDLEKEMIRLGLLEEEK